MKCQFRVRCIVRLCLSLQFNCSSNDWVYFFKMFAALWLRGLFTYRQCYKGFKDITNLHSCIMIQQFSPEHKTVYCLAPPPFLRYHNALFSTFGQLTHAPFLWQHFIHFIYLFLLYCYNSFFVLSFQLLDQHSISLPYTLTLLPKKNF